MATSWQMAINSGSGYSSYYNITNPTNELTIQYTTTRTKYNLYNGSIGRTAPSTKCNYGDLNLEFSYISQDNNLIKTVSGSTMSLQDIITNGYVVKIKTHLYENSKYKVIEGYLIDVGKPWSLGLFFENGVQKQFFDLSCTMDVISETWV